MSKKKQLNRQLEDSTYHYKTMKTAKKADMSKQEFSVQEAAYHALL